MSSQSNGSLSSVQHLGSLESRIIGCLVGAPHVVHTQTAAKYSVKVNAYIKTETDRSQANGDRLKLQIPAKHHVPMQQMMKGSIVSTQAEIEMLFCRIKSFRYRLLQELVQGNGGGCLLHVCDLRPLPPPMRYREENPGPLDDNDFDE